MTKYGINNWENLWKSDRDKIPLKLVSAHSIIDGPRFWLEVKPEEWFAALRLDEFFADTEDKVVYMVAYNNSAIYQSAQQFRMKYNTKGNYLGTLIATYTLGDVNRPTPILMDMSPFGAFDTSQNPSLFVAGDKFFTSEKYFFLHNNRITYENPITNKVYELVRVRIKYDGKHRYEFLTWAGNETDVENIDREWIRDFLKNEASYALTDTVKLSDWYQAIVSPVFSYKLRIEVEDVYVYTDFDE